MGKENWVNEKMLKMFFLFLFFFFVLLLLLLLMLYYEYSTTLVNCIFLHYNLDHMLQILGFFFFMSCNYYYYYYCKSVLFVITDSA